MKFVGSIEFEIWTVVWKNLNDVTMTSSPIRFLRNSNTNLPRAFLSDIPNLVLIRQKRAEILCRKLIENYEEKMVNYVTVTLTFDSRSPISIGPSQCDKQPFSKNRF